ncbi:MAG TPA: imidazolonepropionase [Bacteroidia bacterium]|nr:imidazolonepropionase [Bacteroidia bacterium]
MSLLIKNIGTLVHTESDIRLKYSGAEMSALQTIENAFVFVEKDTITSFGKMGSELFQSLAIDKIDTVIDATGRHVFPSWCDSHTHIVYAGSREREFVDRINGLTYEEIFSRGGGILNSASNLRKATEQELFEQAMVRVNEIISLGTGSVEIKSGYGLSLESELKMLRVIGRIKESSPITVKATFLGAHAVPTEFKGNKAGYLKMLIDELLPAIASEKLAEYCDIFCEQNYFSPEDAMQLFEASNKYGLQPKVHAEQLSHSGGIQAGVKSGAISVDHLEFINDDDIAALKGSSTMPVILPGAQFFLGLQKPEVRKMISAGLPVAISSDFNPGSCPSGNMNQMISLACILYKMTPEEAIIASTTNSAYAMGLSNTHGSIAVGKKANLFVTKEIPSYNFIPYSFGSVLIDTVILNGKKIS